MAAPPPLHFVIVGHEDHPIYEADLTAKSAEAVASGKEVRGERAPRRARCGSGGGAQAGRQAQAHAPSSPPPPPAAAPSSQERPQYLYHFVLHAALDAVEEAEFGGGSGGGGMYLGVVDRFNAYQVSAFTTAARVRFLLLHDGRSDDLVKSFLKDVHELYLRVGEAPRRRPDGQRGGERGRARRGRVQQEKLGKTSQAAALPAGPPACEPPPRRAPQVMLNPFFTPTTKITSPLFHQKVKQLARNYFR